MNDVELNYVEFITLRLKSIYYGTSTMIVYLKQQAKVLN